MEENFEEMSDADLESYINQLDKQIAALDSRQMAYKIMANALYGAVANAGFRYYDLRIAEAITLTGQACNIHVERKLNEYMNRLCGTKMVDYSIYGDTDSQYIDFQPLINKFCSGKSDEEVIKFIEKVEGEFQKVIHKSIDELYDRCNCYVKLMDMKREAIASRGFWTAKKRYALKVHDSEGVKYNPPLVKVTGLEIVKSSTPKVVRDMLKGALPVIFDGNEEQLREYVEKCKEQFMALPPEDMAFPRSANDIEKFSDREQIYKKGTPMHCKAALLYNHFTMPHRNNYQEIGNGDKIKFISLMTPNPIHEEVFGFPSAGRFPKELNLEKYIDKNQMWEKAFIAPLNIIADAIKWKLEVGSTLEDFFS